MSSPFVAEIRMFAGNFAPRGWASCDGQLMAISQNTALFSLLGTTYGGDGKSTFGLPNFQGSAAMGQGNGAGLTPRFLGENGGEQTVTLLQTEMPNHSHTFQVGVGGARGGASTPTNNYLGSGVVGTDKIYATPPGNTTMNPLALTLSGSSFPHNNMPPFLCVYFIIAMQGVFPARP
ncbi:MAG TPA: tail fiber protein [Bryobacteraceae bacterium]|jgi:microcystin-dependent protein|nr:tail fiber protein [Bryobacteraceae bacterium]